MKETVKKKQNCLWTIFLTILITVSLVLIFNHQISAHLVKSYQANVTKAQIYKNLNQSRLSDYDWSQVKKLSFTDVILAQLQKDKLNIIGFITMPKINMNLPIVSGLDNKNLALAAGTMWPSQKMGEDNYPLTSHHLLDSDSLFGPIYYKAKSGQMIYVTDLDKVYAYKADKPRFIEATDVQVADIDQDGQNMITLISCDPVADKRWVLQADLVKTYDFNEAPKEAKLGFSKANKALK